MVQWFLWMPFTSIRTFLLAFSLPTIHTVLNKLKITTALKKTENCQKCSLLKKDMNINNQIIWAEVLVDTTFHQKVIIVSTFHPFNIHFLSTLYPLTSELSVDAAEVTPAPNRSFLFSSLSSSADWKHNHNLSNLHKNNILQFNIYERCPLIWYEIFVHLKIKINIFSNDFELY